MKKQIYFVIIVLFLCSIWILYHHIRSGSSIKHKEDGKEIVFKEKQLDIGSVFAENAPFAGIFHFVNLTDNKIELGGNTCCGSTITFKNDKEVYKPGEEGEVIFTINGVPASTDGFYTKTATIFRKDNNEPVALLELIANIKRKFYFLPIEIKFGDVKPGQTLKANLEIESGTEDLLEVIGIREPLPPFLKVEQITKSNINKRLNYKFMVSIAGDGVERYVNDAIYFRTNSTNMPEIRIPFDAEMMGPIAVKPKSLFWDKVLLGKTTPKTVRIVSTCREELFIKKMSSTLNYVQMGKLSPIEEGIDIELLFTCPPKISGIVRGELLMVIQKASNGLEEIKIPWIAIVGDDK